MDFRYKPDDYEAKLIILYAIKKLKKSPSYQTLSAIITPAADINYFDMDGYIKELGRLDSVVEYQVEGETVFSLAKAGEEMCEFFASRIPASIREKIDNTAYEINNDRSDENKTYADYLPINEHEYRVKCGILENNMKVLDFEMYAGPKERAKKVCEYFKEYTSEFYQSLMNMIEENMKKDRE